MYCLKTSISKYLLAPLTLLVAGVLGTGCENKAASGSAFYPIDSVVQRQIAVLLQEGSSLEKIVGLNGKYDTISLVPDSSLWARELEFFSQINAINKPVNRSLYEMRDQPDSRSNLTVRTITASEKDLSVQNLSLFFLRNILNLRRIDAETHESNSMFEGHRVLRFDFENKSGQPTLKSYEIKGGQKMFLGDSVTYSIKATISAKHGQAK